MCGIFGISKKINASEDYNNIFLDLKTLVSLSEPRGSDTFGVSFKLKDKNILYKLSEKPTKVILKNSFKTYKKFEWYNGQDVFNYIFYR